MPIQGFDYKTFAIALSKHAEDKLNQGGVAIPDSLTDADKKNIVDTVKEFCQLCGDALSNDSLLNFNAEQASLVTQFIGDWTFRKSIDLINDLIPIKKRKAILQTIAANIFNTAKIAIIKKMPQDALVNLIEDKVKQVYEEEIQKLSQKLSPVLMETFYNVNFVHLIIIVILSGVFAFVLRNMEHKSALQERTINQLQIKIVEQEKQIVDLNLKLAGLLEKMSDVSQSDSKTILKEQKSSVEKSKWSN